MRLRIHGATIERPGGRGELGFRLELERFEAAAGARIGLVGPSGSGKSTLLELFALLLRPARLDRFEVDGADLTGAVRDGDADDLARARAAHFAFAPQHGALLPFLSVRENATLAARIAGRDEGATAAAVDTTAKRLGVYDLLGKPPGRLSGGERHRAALLRAATSGARVIIADEPTAALDRRTAETAFAVLVESADRADAALICASHDEALLRRNDFRIIEVRNELDADGAMRVATAA